MDTSPPDRNKLSANTSRAARSPGGSTATNSRDPSRHRDHNVLDGLVRRSLALVIDRNLQANADRYGTPQFGSHLERYLVDALRRLAASNSAWVPNREKSRVWFGREGLFLVWPQSAGDVQALLEADQLRGIPKAPETMLELLLAAGVFEAQEGGHTTWTIQPPETRTVLEAVKLSSPAILFAGVDPTPPPLDVRLVRKPGEPPPSAPRPPPSAAGSPGTQLSLIQPPPTPDEVDGPPTPELPAVPVPTAAPTAPEPPPQPAFTLKAPLRLNPAVRDALAAVVQTCVVCRSLRRNCHRQAPRDALFATVRQPYVQDTTSAFAPQFGLASGELGWQ